MTSKKQNIVIVDPEYQNWVKTVGERFRSQQIKAAIHINSDRLEFYWQLGHDICEMHVEDRWGETVVDQLSADLKRTIPDGPSFSRRNLYYMKSFYKLYSSLFVPQVEAQIAVPEFVPQVDAQNQNVPQFVEDFHSLHHVETNRMFPINIFAIPWGHHKLIIDRYQTEPHKALFYAAKTLENNWSRATLLNMLGDRGQNNGLYESQGAEVNNFPATLPKPNSDLARELMRDPLNLSFVSLKEDYEEKELKMPWCTT